MAKSSTTSRSKAQPSTTATKTLMRAQREVRGVFSNMVGDFQRAKRVSVERLGRAEGRDAVARYQAAHQPLGEELDDVVARHADTMVDEYTLQDPYGDLVNKRTVIQRLRSGRAIFDEVAYADVDIRVYGGLAVVTDAITLKGVSAGREMTATYRETHVLRRAAGGWRFLTTAMSIVQPTRGPLPIV